MEIDGSEFHGLKLLAHCGGGAYGDVFYSEDISGRRMAVKIISKKKLMIAVKTILMLVLLLRQSQNQIINVIAVWSLVPN